MSESIELKELREDLMKLLNKVDILISGKKKKVYYQPDDLINKICAYYCITTEELRKVTSRGGKHELVRKRQVTMRLLRELSPKISRKKAGELVGYKAHGSALRLINEIDDILSNKTWDINGLKKEYQEVKKTLEE